MGKWKIQEAGKYRIMNLRCSAGVGRGLCFSFFGTFGADGYSGFLDHRPADLEVVMTGRKPPEELLLRADYVTEMEKIKHPFDRKILARRGIEY